MTPKNAPSGLTIREGGWVLIVLAVLLLSLVMWAVAPALFRLSAEHLGDGRSLESYGFDLTDLELPREQIVPAMQHRDMAPALTDPAVLTMTEVEQRDAHARDPLLVTDDLVIGLLVNGEARAYPLHMLHVHEIINDRIGNLAIAVTWHWPSGNAAVFSRKLLDGEAEFGNSGLAGNGGMLIYPRSNSAGGEKLYSPLAAGTALQHLPFELTTWKRWLASNPDTSVLSPVVDLKKRYRKGSPDLYFSTSDIYFPGSPMPDAAVLPHKARVLAVDHGGDRRVYPLSWLLEASQDGRVTDELGGTTIVFDVEDHPLSAVARTTNGSPVDARPALWFAWHANHPTDPLWGVRHR